MYSVILQFRNSHINLHKFQGQLCIKLLHIHSQFLQVLCNLGIKLVLQLWFSGHYNKKENEYFNRIGIGDEDGLSL